MTLFRIIIRIMSERLKGSNSGKGLRIGIVISRFNSEVTEGLHRGAMRALLASDIADADITTVEVPGAFEIPFALDALASGKEVDALIALGCVIKGETAHFEYISEAAMQGISRVQEKSGIPVSCGVLTTYTEEQAVMRSGNNEENKGSEAALTAVEMANLAKLLNG
jgi:6,7-dimethyl-8-ribityllumazine synthase